MTLGLLIVLSIVGCARPDGSVGDATVSALLGVPSFAGRWRCKPNRLPGTRWYQRSARNCTAEDSSGTTSTLVQTLIDRDGSIDIANRDWWNRDSTAWIARRDSLVHALLVRFPNAALCQGPPAAFTPPSQPAQPGVIRDRRAWRAQGYDVAISILGRTTSSDPYGHPVYTLSLDVAKAPGWILECGTEAQWMKHSRPTVPRRSTDSARR